MEELTESDKKLIQGIEENGWHVMKVMGEGKDPKFAFSIGLYETFGHPEILFIGLEFELMHILINNIGDDIRSGKKYESGQFYSGILDGFDCLMIDVAKENYLDYLGYAMWYYRRKNKEFPVLQCLYPTVKGIYPWDDKWPKEIKNLQPILGEVSL